MLKSSRNLKRRASEKFCLKKLLSGKIGTNKIKSLADLVGKLTRKMANTRMARVIRRKTSKKRNLANVEQQLQRQGEETKEAVELNANQKEGTSKAPVSRPLSDTGNLGSAFASLAGIRSRSPFSVWSSHCD